MVIKQYFQNGYAILQPIGCQINDVNANTQIFEPASKVFTEIMGGAYTNKVIEFLILFNIIGTSQVQYIQFVVDGSSLSIPTNTRSIR